MSIFYKNKKPSTKVEGFFNIMTYYFINKDYLE
jgi:hypothetical protein